MEGVATSDSLSRARDYVDRSRSKTDTSGSEVRLRANRCRRGDRTTVTSPRREKKGRT